MFQHQRVNIYLQYNIYNRKVLFIVFYLSSINETVFPKKYIIKIKINIDYIFYQTLCFIGTNLFYDILALNVNSSLKLTSYILWSIFCKAKCQVGLQLKINQGLSKLILQPINCYNCRPKGYILLLLIHEFSLAYAQLIGRLNTFVAYIKHKAQSYRLTLIKYIGKRYL